MFCKNARTSYVVSRSGARGCWIMFWAFCTNARTSFDVSRKCARGCWDERSRLENAFAPERAKSKKANTDHGWWFSIFHQVSAMQELCIILWIGWYEKNLKKSPSQRRLKGGEAAAPTGEQEVYNTWERSSLDMTSHYEHESNSEENHYWNA